MREIPKIDKGEKRRGFLCLRAERFVPVSLATLFLMFEFIYVHTCCPLLGTTSSRQFEKTVILLPDYQPEVRPIGREKTDLAVAGFGSKTIIFNDTDSVDFVVQKIYQ